MSFGFSENVERSSGRCYHVTIITISVNARKRIYKSYSLNINYAREWQI